MLWGCFACLALGADAARGATFTVDATLNGGDITLDGVCDADASTDTDCSLTAAVEEANNTAAADIISFKKGSVTGGDPDDVSFDPSSNARLIDEPPPAITQPLTVDAGNCELDLAEPPKPCASVESGWVVDSPGEVRISGLAFQGEGSGAELIGIDVVEADGTVPALPDFMLTNSYFGLDRNGIEADVPLMAPAVLLEDVAGARIGTGFLADRNVFARQGVAVDVLGADDTEVFGNTFGLLPDGSLAVIGESVANQEAVEVTGDSAPNPDDEATGTEIGASSPTGATTPECDLGCNEMVSSGIADTGSSPPFPAIDLGGEPGEGEIPANGARVLGNQIGVVARNAVAIAVGDADDVQIGGPAAGDADRNLLGVGEITSGAGATSLLIENNVVNAGTDSAPLLDLRGSGTVLGNYLNGSFVTQADIRLSDTSGSGFTVQGNFIGENEDGSAATSGLVAIDLTATASGNLIGGDGPGEGNLISDLVAVIPAPAPNSAGIRIAGDSNEIAGNRIGVGSDGSVRHLMAGIRLETDADDNVVGGETAASENLISNTGLGAFATPFTAISVADAASDGNLILRNRGTDNDGPFIDLGLDGAGNLVEPNGPNGGAQAPVISAISPTAASGTAAPGAVVRLFTKANADPGDVSGFIAQATADGSGAWSTDLSAAEGTLVAATATTSGGTSELSATATVIQPTVVEPGDSDPPETTFTRTPKKKVKTKGKGKKAKGKAIYEFGADEPGASFTCAIDRKPPAPCSSPLKLKRLKKGKHTVSVFATDAAGNADPTPASHKFKVKAKRKKR